MSWHLERVNTLPRVKSRENFLGLRRSIGRKDIASPKHIVPGENVNILGGRLNVSHDYQELGST